MSIGKNSIRRVENAEKNGAANIVSVAPDMESSTPLTPTPKKPKGRPAGKKRAVESTVIGNPSPETVRLVRGDSCPIGAEMPTHLL